VNRGVSLYSDLVRVRRLSIAGALVLLGLAGLAETAHACSCAPPGPVEALQRSDAAIVGRLIEVVPRNDLWADYRYRVRRVYRGARKVERGEVISVQSNRSAAACGLPRRQDRPIGIFLLRDGDRWRSGICSTISPHRLWAAARRGYGARVREVSCTS
jgi:hypothetical protein